MKRKNVNYSLKKIEAEASSLIEERLSNQIKITFKNKLRLPVKVQITAGIRGRLRPGSSGGEPVTTIGVYVDSKHINNLSIKGYPGETKMISMADELDVIKKLYSEDKIIEVTVHELDGVMFTTRKIKMTSEEKEELMKNTRFVYLRSDETDQQYPQPNMPVGCVAYKDLGNGKFAFGLSFFNSDVDNIDKVRARQVAGDRLVKALKGVRRKHCQGRFGTLSAEGTSLNEKLANLLAQVQKGHLRGNVEVRDRVRSQLRALADRLRKPKNQAA